MNQKAKKVIEQLNIFKKFTFISIFGRKRPWIRIRNAESGICIRIEIKTMIRIRIKAYEDPNTAF